MKLSEKVSSQPVTSPGSGVGRGISANEATRVRVDLARGHWQLGERADAVMSLERAAAVSPLYDGLLMFVESCLEELESGGPVYTPYSAGALLLNRDEIADILRDRYPYKMRQQRLGGLTTLWLLIDKSGNPRKAVLQESSGYEVFDSLAIDVVPLMRFSPAINNGTPKNVWVQLPIRFRVVD